MTEGKNGLSAGRVAQRAARGAWHRSRPPPRCAWPRPGAQRGAVSPAALPAPVSFPGREDRRLCVRSGGGRKPRRQRHGDRRGAAASRVPPPRKRCRRCPAGSRGSRVRACGSAQRRSWTRGRRQRLFWLGVGAGRQRHCGSPGEHRAYSRSTTPGSTPPGRQYLPQRGGPTAHYRRRPEEA